MNRLSTVVICVSMLAMSGFDQGRPLIAQNDRAPYCVTVSDPLDFMLNRGYRYLRVTIKRMGPNAAANHEQVYRIIHESSDANWEGGNHKLVAEIRIPAGQSSGSAEIFPNSGGEWWQHQYERLVVDLNGDDIARGPNEVTVNLTAARSYKNRFMVAPWLTFLFVTDKAIGDWSQYIQVVDPMSPAAPAMATQMNQADWVQLPNVGALCRLVGGATKSQNLSALSINQIEMALDPALVPDDTHQATLINELAQFMALPPGELPTRWYGLMPVGFVVISASDWRQMMSAHPQQWNSVCDWIQMGGRLVITGCSSTTAVSEEFDRTTQRSVVDDRIRNEWQCWDQTNWDQISTELKNFVLNSPTTTVDVITHLFRRSPMIPGIIRSPKLRTGRSGDEEITFSDWGLGRVVLVYRDSSDFTENDWMQVLASGTVDAFTRSPWTTAGDDRYRFDYSALFVPGVGTPPFIAFLILITGFSIVVGPVLYFVLSRRRRLGLLIVVVPAISLVTSVSLVSYAILRDGFEFRVVRLSGSFLDSRSGTLITQTEHAIYSGLHPGSYEFEPTAAVFEPNLVDQRARSGRKWMGLEATVLRGDWIRGRQQHQLCTLTHTATDKRLTVFSEADQDDTTWWVQNELGHHVKLVLVSTPDGLLFAEDVGAGRSKLGLVQGDIEMRSLLSPLLNELDGRERMPGYYTPSSYYPNNEILVELCRVHANFDQFVVGLSRRSQRLLMQHQIESVQDRLPLGQWMAFLDDFDGAGKLKPQEKYIFQRHVIYGRW
ncbi:MAG TPA: hypothetical protein PKD54_00085 [Pirellulaceae bacterium]|nr:hypothetical protein [Pirellulaceae bacterium]